MEIINKFVIGAGLAGLTAACIRNSSSAERIWSTQVYEKEHVAGGLCANWFVDTYSNGFIESYRDEFRSLSYSPCRYGDHVFHTNNEVCYKVFNELYDTEVFEMKTLSLSQGEIFDWPINANTLTKFGFKEDIILKLFRKFPHGSSFTDMKSISNDAEFLHKCTLLYNALILPYSKKQWGEHAFSKTIENRVKVYYDYHNVTFRDRYQCVPVKMDYSNTKLLKRKDIKFNFNSKVDVSSFKNDGKFFDGTLIVNTTSIDKFYKCKTGLPYRTCDFIYGYDHNSEYDKLPMAINVPDELFPYTRIHKNGKILNFEYPRDAYSNDIPMYPFEDVDIFKYLIENLPENKLRVLSLLDGTNVFIDVDSAPNAVIVHVGRLATYSYLNMDRTILQVLLTMEYISTASYDALKDLPTVYEYFSRNTHAILEIDDKFGLFRVNPVDYAKLVIHPDATDEEKQLLNQEVQYYNSLIKLLEKNKLPSMFLPATFTSRDENNNESLHFTDVETHKCILKDEKNETTEIISTVADYYCKYIDAIHSDAEIKVPDEFESYEPLKKTTFCHGDLRLENIFYRRLANGDLSIQLRWPKGSSCIGNLLNDLISIYKSTVKHNCVELGEIFITRIATELKIDDIDGLIQKIKNI